MPPSSTDTSRRIQPPTAEAIAAAAEILRTGNLVAFPTETVYGLGADATNDRAVAGIFEAKGRPRFNPLIVHVFDAAAAAEIVQFDDRARAIAARFWPGAVTLVLPRAPDCPISLLCGAGLPSLAVRVPAHPVAQALLHAIDRPLAAPSANPSGAVSPTTAAHVAEGFGATLALILDGGPCPIGLESTVLDLTGAQAVLLRPGGVTRDDIEAVIGPVRLATADTPVAAPGMLASHYAPSRPVRLDATSVAADEGLLAFGGAPLPGAARTINLSPTGDLREAAANLFAALHALDRSGVRAIAVMTIPETGLGAAVNDRLRRAAA